MSKPIQLTETYLSRGALQVVEETASGTLKASGPFAAIGVPTKNRRVYNKALWETSLERLAPVIEANRLAGELDHPDDGRTRATRISHMITGLRIVNEEIHGDLTVFDTPSGQTVKALIKGGYGLGVSSRGQGTLKKRADGYEDVEDFVLQTFDLVVDPAAANAYPAFFESTDAQVIASLVLDEDVTSAVIPTPVTGPLAAEEIEEKLRAKLADELAQSMALFRKEAFSKAQAELAANPAFAPIGGERAALESIASLIAPFLESGNVIGDKLTKLHRENTALREELAATKATLAETEAQADAALTRATTALAAMTVPSTKVEHVIDPDAHRTLQEHASELRATVRAVQKDLDAATAKHAADRKAFVAEAARSASEVAALSRRAVLAEAKLQAAVSSGDKVAAAISECISEREVKLAIKAIPTAPIKPLSERFPGASRSGLSENFSRVFRKSLQPLEQATESERDTDAVDESLGEGLEEAVKLTGMSRAAALGRSRT